ncbi:protein translocase SEC61 complex subunit gamma [Methanocella arvoryzae]|uniref:Protein translocase subunit SecE n=1 Tax=Methanocella arvoryzae (strain DSM 22066 / NBRC 105507 / MRE50) TaxID=351160 RepID=Q0W047_METAR|nr:protein translocase SEC61 complex subunit gamma [Methanocella arvoryzae]CAJ38246.1 putative preprotein translocase, subunit E [Methanocella arvoryzae MRE50]
MAEKATQNQFSLETITGVLKQYYRIIQLTRKPTNEEFFTIAKVAGAGILLIGVIGFAIYLIMVQLPKLVGF